MYTAKDAQEQANMMKAGGASKAEIVRALAELCLGWPYVYASNGEMCTPEWRRGRIPYCPEQKYVDMIKDNCQVIRGASASCSGCKWDGCRCFDCQGFVHWLLEMAGVPLYGAGATTQWNTASNWAAKGEIKTLPRNLVCVLYKHKDGKMSHAGMYFGECEVWSGNECEVWSVKSGVLDSDSNFGQPIGTLNNNSTLHSPNSTLDNNSTLHSSNSTLDNNSTLHSPNSTLIIHCSTIVKSDVLPGTPAWTHWAIPAGLYTTEELRKAGLNVDESKNIPTLRRGSNGDAVEELQALLNAKYGTALDVDGKFGAKTEAAVKAFQQAHGLTADGIVGPKTWAALGVKSSECRVQSADNLVNKQSVCDDGNLYKSELSTLNSELSSPLSTLNSEPFSAPLTIQIPLEEWRTIKAAMASIQYILKKYEEEA